MLKVHVLIVLYLIFGLVTGTEKSDEESEDVTDIIGDALDVFANYGDLSQMMQVISSDYEDASLFTERTIRVFDFVKYRTTRTGRIDRSLTFLFCDTFEDLVNSYYNNFAIQGTDKPWKVFMGDWLREEILRSLGIAYDAAIGPDGYCCFVLTRISKVHETLSLDGAEQNFSVTPQMREAAEGMSEDERGARRFARSYGTHYVDSLSTGNSVYQVFVYSRIAYRRLKMQMRHRRSAQLKTDDLRFYTSSVFLRQIGQVMVSSGNKTVEDWCETNLRDSQYLFSRPTLLKLYNNATLLHRLDAILDNGAVLHMKLKVVAPVFKDERKRRIFEEVVDNDIKLWEVSV